jgi:hypothetical protein
MLMAGAYPELSGKPERNIGALSRTKGERLKGVIFFEILRAPAFANLGGTATSRPMLGEGCIFLSSQNIISVYFLIIKL